MRPLLGLHDTLLCVLIVKLVQYGTFTVLLQRMQQASYLKTHQEMLQRISTLENQLDTASAEILKVQKENTTLHEKFGELQTSHNSLQQYTNVVEEEKELLVLRIEKLQKDKEKQIAAIVDALRTKLLKGEQAQTQLENEVTLIREQQQNLHWENAQLKSISSKSQYVAEENERLSWDNQELKEALEKSNRLVESLRKEYADFKDQIVQLNNKASPAAVYPHTNYAYFSDSASNEKLTDILLPSHSQEYLPTLSQEYDGMFSRPLSQEHSFYASPLGALSQEHSSAALGMTPGVSRPMSQECSTVPRSNYHMQFTGKSRSQEDSCLTFLPQTIHEQPSFYHRSSSLGKIQTVHLPHTETKAVITADGILNVLCQPISTLDELHTGDRVVVHRCSGNECGTVRALYVKIDKKPCYVGVELDLPSLWFDYYYSIICTVLS